MPPSRVENHSRHRRLGRRRPGSVGHQARLLARARPSWRSRAPPRRRRARTRRRSGPRRPRESGRTARESRRARTRRAGSPGPRRAPRRGAGGRTRSRPRRARGSAGPRQDARVARDLSRDDDLLLVAARERRRRRLRAAAADVELLQEPLRPARSDRSGKSQPHRRVRAPSRKSWSAMFSASVKSSTSPRS